MKTFYFSIALFVLTLAAVAVNHAFINRTSDRLVEMTEALPPADDPACADAVSEIYDHWQKKHDIARISVSYIELNRVTDAISTMKVYAESGYRADFENARALLLNAIDEMRRLESFSPGSIF